MDNDLDTWRRADMLGVDIDRVHKRKPYIPMGCDQQGRHPQAAEACTDMGVERDDLSCASGIVWAVIVSLMVYAALTFAYLALT